MFHQNARHWLVLLVCSHLNVSRTMRTRGGESNLELDHLALAFLVAAQLEVLAALQRCLFAVFALGALHTKDNLFGCLSLQAQRVEKQSKRTNFHQLGKNDIWRRRCDPGPMANDERRLPSSGRWAWFDRQNLVVYDRNDGDPAMLFVPWTFCTVSPCAICGTCTSCRRSYVVLVRSPGKRRQNCNWKTMRNGVDQMANMGTAGTTPHTGTHHDTRNVAIEHYYDYHQQPNQSHPHTKRPKSRRKCENS